MLRKVIFVVGAATLVLASHAAAPAKGQFGSPQEAKAMLEKATEGEILEVTYWWPRPGEEKPMEKHTFCTKVGDQNCGVGFYKE